VPHQNSKVPGKLRGVPAVSTLKFRSRTGMLGFSSLLAAIAECSVICRALQTQARKQEGCYYMATVALQNIDSLGVKHK
jgi:hypothetical protein